MNDEIQRSRSPNSPKFDLSVAVTIVKNLYDKIGRAAVKAEVAASALGYSGLNGAALGTLGAISQYNLIDRGTGTVQVTGLALRILHPVDEPQKLAALREAALTPKVFADIYANSPDMAEEILANHLIHQRFTPESAKRAASVYKTNYSLANLGTRSSNLSSLEEGTAKMQKVEAQSSPLVQQSQVTPPSTNQAVPIRSNVLATYKIPLGTAEAELIFTGDSLNAESFVVLKEYVDMFEKQCLRKAKALGAGKDAPNSDLTNAS